MRHHNIRHSHYNYTTRCKNIIGTVYQRSQLKDLLFDIGDEIKMYDFKYKFVYLLHG